MRKVHGSPKFDSLSLGGLKVDRISQAGDVVEATFAYVHSGSRQSFGSIVLNGMLLMSERSKELLTQLVESLEGDAARIIFNDQPHEETKEGIHDEPQGIADEAEEDDQV